MADEVPEIKPPVEIKCLKENAVVSIEITAQMYQRIQTLLLSGVVFKNIETMTKVLSTIKNSNTDPDAQTYHTRTLIWLLTEIEAAADKQNMLETKQIDRTTGKPVTPQA